MASFRKRKTKGGEDRWEASVRLRGSAPMISTHRRLTDAKRWAAEKEAGIRERRHFGRAGPTRRTVGEAISRYLAERLDDLAPSDRRKRASVLAWWRERIGHVRLAELEPESFSAALVDLAERGLSPGRQNRYMAAISKVLTIAVREWRWSERNPAREVTRRREPPGRIRVLSEAERDRLLASVARAENPILEPLVRLALSTAARQGELLALEWRDVDLRRGVATFRQTKNRSDRTIPLAPPAREVLAAIPGDHVGRVFHADHFPHRAWLAVLRDAGIENFRFHDLRHTAASYLAMSGATARELAEILGHRTMAMVMRYSHFFDSHLSGVVEKMNERFLTKPSGQSVPRSSR